jgi:hypothetical protein
LEVWQAKGLREGIFGSVANTGVTGEIADVWQGKELAKSPPEEEERSFVPQNHPGCKMRNSLRSLPSTALRAGGMTRVVRCGRRASGGRGRRREPRGGAGGRIRFMRNGSL